MKKTSLYLPAYLDERLTEVAAEEGVTKAELIRQALLERVDGTTMPAEPAIGVHEGPEDGDVSQDVDKYLAETGFGEW
jgi:hypothetical protein